MVFLCESYANNIGVRLARWERDSDSERLTQKGKYEWRVFESVKYSDYWYGVCAMHVLGVA